MKRFLSFLCALVMVLSMVPAVSFAAEVRTIYWDPVAGLDTNSGLTEAAPVKSVEAAYTALSGADEGVLVLQDTLTLTGEQKAKLDANFVNGAYVEGFVSVTPLATAEGLLAPEHTIPVLGFYGNWSDPSMFDKGCYQTAGNAGR